MRKNHETKKRLETQVRQIENRRKTLSNEFNRLSEKIRTLEEKRPSNHNIELIKNEIRNREALLARVQEQYESQKKELDDLKTAHDTFKAEHVKPIFTERNAIDKIIKKID